MRTRLGINFDWLHLEPLLAVMLWGGIYPGVKFGLRDIPVLSFTALRILLATVVLFTVTSRGQSLTLPRDLWKPLVNAGLAQLTFQLLLIAGLHRTTAGNSAILLATAPLLTMGWLVLTGRGRLVSRQWQGLLLGLSGIGLVVQGEGLGLTWSQLGGDLFAVGAAGAWAWYSLAIGPLVGTLGALRATGWTMVVAGGLFVPLSLTEMVRHPWHQVSWEAWAGFVYSGTAGLVVAMALWGRAIHQWGAQRTMIYVYLEPISAVVIAAALLGEALSPLQAVGALLTVLGVWLGS
jgi:drug/metabolite transporter (DMT)-like permease